MHLACTTCLTHMHAGDRSAEAIDAGQVLPGYSGVIVRDGYAGYGQLTEAPHAWCGAHLLRDLKGLYMADDGPGLTSPMSDQLFVPADFAVPGGLMAEQFRLEPLGPQHNTADYAAWTASIDHIQQTPGFAGTGWPEPMSLADNLRDLERHAADFAQRRGFTYTVLSTAHRRSHRLRVHLPAARGKPGRRQRGRTAGEGQILGARGPRRTRPCACTAPSWPGWNSTGRSTRSSTRHGDDSQVVGSRVRRWWPSRFSC